MTDVRTGYCAGVGSVRVYTGWSAHEAASRPAHSAQIPASLVSYPASVAERASQVIGVSRY